MGASSTLQETPTDLAYFSSPGQLFVGPGTTRFRFPFPAELVGVSASIGTAPSGDVILDINKNDTTVFTDPPAISYRSVTFASGTSSSAAVSKPAGVVAGDMLVLLVAQENAHFAGFSSLTLPTGFVWRYETSTDVGSSSGERITVATKIADGTEGATLTSSFSSAVDSWKVHCVALPDGVGYVNGTAAGNYDPFGSFSSATLPSITMPDAGGAILVLVHTSASNPTTPAGMTSAGSTAAYRLAYELRPSAGATGTRVSTFTSTGKYRSLMIGLAKLPRSTLPTIPSGVYATVSEYVPDITDFAIGDYLTVDVDQAGLGGELAGSDLSVYIRYRRL